MGLLSKYPRFIKYATLISVSSGLSWIYFQVRRTQEILNNALDTSILDIMEPPPEKRTEKKQNVLGDKWLKQRSPNVFTRIWDNLKFAYARRLLSLAHSDNETLRRKAITQLANIKLLDTWHCSMLANMMDAKTAVGLARCQNVDQRFFMEPPLRYLTYDRDMIVNAMKELLISLYEKSHHPCMGYFISRVFDDEHDGSRLVDHDSCIELSKFIQSAREVLPLCLESLVHHVSIEKYAKDIVELNGLPLLLEVHNRFRDNINVNITLCRILSYISFYPELLGDIYKSGWIGILAQWSEHEDIRLSIPAARALANLDTDDKAIYSRSLYLLHPTKRSTKKTDIDIVVVHGLLGGVFFTWRQRDKDQGALGFIGKKESSDCISQEVNFQSKQEALLKCSDPVTRQFIQDLQEEQDSSSLCYDYEIVWDDIPINTNQCAEGPYTCPGRSFRGKDRNMSYTYCWPKDWLPEEFDNLRVIGIDYNTSLSMWAPMCPSEPGKQNLEERSSELMEKLLKAGVGKRPIIWITHSMGGLIVKNMLSKAFHSNQREARKLCCNTKGIVFYSTPHNGSSLATLSQATSLVLWPSVEVQELREDSPKLLEVHKTFLEIVQKFPIKVITFVETKTTVVTAMKFNFLLVEPHSGNPGVGEYYEIPQDHLGICKPNSRQSFLYQKVVHLIQSVLQNK